MKASISEDWSLIKHGHCFQEMEISKSRKINCQCRVTTICINWCYRTSWNLQKWGCRHIPMFCHVPNVSYPDAQGLPSFAHFLIQLLKSYSPATWLEPLPEYKRSWIHERHNSQKKQSGKHGIWDNIGYAELSGHNVQINYHLKITLDLMFLLLQMPMLSGIKLNKTHFLGQRWAFIVSNSGITIMIIN